MSTEMLIALGTPRTQVHVSQECLGPCPDRSVPSPGKGEAPQAPAGEGGRQHRLPRQSEEAPTSFRPRLLSKLAVCWCSANTEPPR